MATTKKQWDYKMTDEVTLVGSGEKGTIIGRAHYIDSNPSYYVRYVNGEKCLVKAWLDESDIVGVERGGRAIPPSSDD